MNHSIPGEFPIQPDTLYSAAALKRHLVGIMDLETFIIRSRPIKRYRSAYLGSDILDALRSTPELGSDAESSPPSTVQEIPSLMRRRKGRGAPRVAAGGLRLIDPREFNDAPRNP